MTKLIVAIRSFANAPKNRIKTYKIIFTNFIKKGMFLLNPWESYMEAQSSTKHSLNTTDDDHRVFTALFTVLANTAAVIHVKDCKRYTSAYGTTATKRERSYMRVTYPTQLVCIPRPPEHLQYCIFIINQQVHINLIYIVIVLLPDIFRCDLHHHRVSTIISLYLSFYSISWLNYYLIVIRFIQSPTNALPLFM